MKRAAVTVIAVLALGGCDAMQPGAEQIKICEDQLLGTLKSPASYKRISADFTVLDAGAPPHYALVDITYDAANSFNALLRDKYSCSFRIDHGKVTTDQFDPYAGVVDNLDAAADNLDDMDANMAITPELPLQSASSLSDDDESWDETEDGSVSAPPPPAKSNVAADVARDAAEADEADEAARQAVDNAIAANDVGE